MTTETGAMTEAQAREVLGRFDRPLPAFLKPAAILMLIVGGIGFIILAAGAQSQRAWTAYFVNWLFWTGVAQGGVIFHAVTNVAKGRWSAPIARMAEASVMFLPASFVLFLLLWFGRAQIWPWVLHPLTTPHVKAFWLRDWFMFGRDALALAIVTWLMLWFVYHSVRPDAAILGSSAPAHRREFFARLSRGYDTRGEGVSVQRRTDLAPILIIVWGITMSVVVFDVIMSLSPMWQSNLLGGYFVLGEWLAGLMSLALLMLFFRSHYGLEDLITTRHLHDLGKLCFGFTVFWAYLFFAQFIVIWYGNIPEETHFLLLRMLSPEWRGVSIAMIVLVFLLPFWGLIGIAPKKTPSVFATFAVISLTGLWIDRYVFVTPSVIQQTANHGLPLGWQELLVTIGFAGAWGLSYLWFLGRFPMVSPSLLMHFSERRHHAHTAEEDVDAEELKDHL